MSAQIQHSVTVKNKKYAYSLDPKKNGTTLVHCDAAGINQPFLNEDVPALLTDLPHLIIAEQKYAKAQNSVIHFRLKSEEKKRLEQKAVKSGFVTVSAYLRNLALAA